MKTLLFIAVIIFASCSSEKDPEPQVPCETLKVQLHTAQEEILHHQAKGSNGNPDAWKAELNRLAMKRDKIQGEFITRRCL